MSISICSSSSACSPTCSPWSVNGCRCTLSISVLAFAVWPRMFCSNCLCACASYTARDALLRVASTAAIEGIVGTDCSTPAVSVRPQVSGATFSVVVFSPTGVPGWACGHARQPWGEPQYNPSLVQAYSLTTHTHMQPPRLPALIGVVTPLGCSTQEQGLPLVPACVRTRRRSSSRASVW
jgi:hypothetical protein